MKHIPHRTYKGDIVSDFCDYLAEYSDIDLSREQVIYIITKYFVHAKELMQSMVVGRFAFIRIPLLGNIEFRAKSAFRVWHKYMRKLSVGAISENVYTRKRAEVFAAFTHARNSGYLTEKQLKGCRIKMEATLKKEQEQVRFIIK